MKKIRAVLFILFTLYFISVKAQREFLVKVDPLNGNHTIIDSIPTVNYIAQNGSTFDKINHRFIFKGIDFSGNNRLYTVNAITGALLSSPITTLNFAEPHYDNASNKLYAIEIDNINSLFFVSSINLNTGTSVRVDTLPFTGVALASTYFNELTNSYVILSGTKFYSMNVSNGLLSTFQFSTSFTCLTFDNQSGKTYGIHMGPPIVPVEINLNTGTFSAIGSSTLAMVNSSHRAYDQINKRYTYTNGNKLYSISVTSGSVMSQPAFPQGLSGVQNVMELQYDNSNGQLYALHWGAIPITGLNERSLTQQPFDFKIIPNPAQTNINIHLDRTVNNVSVSLYNTQGELILTEQAQNEAIVNIKCNSLAKGIYFIRIEADKIKLGTKRIVID